MKKKQLKAQESSSLELKSKIAPSPEAFLTLLLATVSAAVALVMLITNKYVFPFGNTLLAPMLGQMIALLIPTYLFLQLTSYGKRPRVLLGELGCKKIGAEHIFFLVFTALFMISTSFVLNTLFYGIYKASEGFTILGIFTAGVNEYTVSMPYIILVYAAVPAVIEEFMFRGVIYSGLSKISTPIAVIGSSLISAIFAFTLGGFPAAAFCALGFCFVRYITGSLFSCIIVHFVFNLYGLFLQTNLSKYLLSQQNDVMLLAVTLVVWLICLILFFSECAHIFRERSKNIAEGKEKSKIIKFDIERLKEDALSILAHKPSLACAIVLLLLFAAVTVIGFI